MRGRNFDAFHVFLDSIEQHSELFSLKFESCSIEEKGEPCRETENAVVPGVSLKRSVPEQSKFEEKWQSRISKQDSLLRTRRKGLGN